MSQGTMPDMKSQMFVVLMTTVLICAVMLGLVCALGDVAVPQPKRKTVRLLGQVTQLTRSDRT